MGHKLQRPLIGTAGGSDGVQDFSIGPFIIGKLTTKLIGNIHESVS